MLIAGQFEVPDDCPDTCQFKGQPLGQGSICMRCPIFNCKVIPDPDGEPFSLLEPHEYRSDWAEEWVEFFKTGKVPMLRF